MFKPSKPQSFDGRRDALVVNTWVYQVEVYINLTILNQPQMAVDDNMKIMLATSLMKGSAENWWYESVQSGQAPGGWDALKDFVRNEFVPQDSVRRSCDKLLRVVQRTSVATVSPHIPTSFET